MNIHQMRELHAEVYFKAHDFPYPVAQSSAAVSSGTERLWSRLVQLADGTIVKHEVFFEAGSARVLAAQAFTSSWAIVGKTSTSKALAGLQRILALGYVVQRKEPHASEQFVLVDYIREEHTPFTATTIEEAFERASEMVAIQNEIA